MKSEVWLLTLLKKNGAIVGTFFPTSLYLHDCKNSLSNFFFQRQSLRKSIKMPVPLLGFSAVRLRQESPKGDFNSVAKSDFPG